MRTRHRHFPPAAAWPLLLLLLGLLWPSSARPAEPAAGGAAGGAAGALSVERFRGLYQDENFGRIAEICDASAGAIEGHEYVDRFLYYCGQARFRLYEDNGPDALLDRAIDDLERSVHLYYLPSTAFALGRARMAAVANESSPEKRRAGIRRAMEEMWGAMQKRHAQEGFRSDVLSDTLLGWSISYYEALIERIADEDEAAVRWLTARLRMLTDRYREIDPSAGENPTRQTNLKTISDWIHQLYEATYFDNRPAVGMLRFLGDRKVEQYDQTAATEAAFLTALAYYDKALGGAQSLTAKAVLKEKISYLTSLYNSDDKEKKILYYKVGFFHANSALELLNQPLAGAPGPAYPFAPAPKDLLGRLRINYGRNISGLLYFLWEKGDYPAVVTLRSAFDVPFDWKTKLDDLLRIADASAKLARNEFRDPDRERNLLTFDAYKEICLSSAAQAFDYAFGALQAAGLEQEEFCATLETYTAFLSGFGEIAEATSLSSVYGPLCEDREGGKP